MTIEMVAPSGRTFEAFSEEEAAVLERLGWERADDLLRTPDCALCRHDLEYSGISFGGSCPHA